MGTNNDIDIMFEMNDEMNDFLFLRGWNLLQIIYNNTKIYVN